MQNISRSIIVLSFLVITLTLSSQTDFSNLKYEELGPLRGGRVTAVTGDHHHPNIFYFGATGGGVWKSTDYGTSWKNISDGFFGSPSIGAIRVAPSNSDIIYVGTGTDGFRSNIITGDGMYKSMDGGKTWKNIGLIETGFIGAVEIDPKNADIVYVAAIGNAFMPNEDRGVFKTIDGGTNWQRVLYLSDTTGFVDLEIHPKKSKIVYAAAWRAERKPWTIISGGLENGIYRSDDGGKSWSKKDTGLPAFKGKIDLAVSMDDPDVLYALVEAHGKESGLYRSTDKGDHFIQMSDHEDLLNRAFYYTNLSADPQDANTVYVMGKPFWRSKNGGKKWDKLSAPHGDHHALWVNPENSDLLIQSNDGGANVSHNGGKTWSTQFNQPTSEIYQVEVDEQFPYWVYGGQQDNYTTVSVPSRPPSSKQIGSAGFIMDTGGCETGPAVPNPLDPDIVYSNCKGRFSVFNKRTGEEKYYDVGVANMYGHNPGDLKYRFQRVSPIHISPHDPSVIYHCSQYVHKTTDEGKTWKTISPDLTANEPKSQVISGGPITRDITGEEFYSTIYAIRESKIQKGLIWVGSNDGPVHVTTNGGKDWTDATPAGLLPGGRVDCVEPSPHDPAKAYISVLRYQLGDYRPYIFRTNDYGQTWTLLSKTDNGLPAKCPTRVVREDPVRPGLLYAGTDVGMYISMDDGDSWQAFQQNLPIAPITDIKIHRGDLVISTMGRGFWKIDQINPLRYLSQLDEEATDILIQPADIYNYRNHRLSRNEPLLSVIRYEAHGLAIDYFLKEENLKPVELSIYDDQGMLVNRYISEKDTSQSTSEDEAEWERDMATGEITAITTDKLENSQGWHRFKWNLRHAGAWDKDKKKSYNNGPMAIPARYSLVLTTESGKFEQEFEIKMNPTLLMNGINLADLEEQKEVSLTVRDLLSDVKRMGDRVEKELKAGTINAEDLVRWKEAKAALITKKGAYPQPMLIGQVSYLYGSLNRAHQKPGSEVYKRLAELKEHYQNMKDEFGLLTTSD